MEHERILKTEYLILVFFYRILLLVIGKLRIKYIEKANYGYFAVRNASFKRDFNKMENRMNIFYRYPDFAGKRLFLRNESFLKQTVKHLSQFLEMKTYYIC